MNVKCAKDNIEQIIEVCNKISAFDLKHTELQDEVGFLCDAVAFLSDYRKSFRKGDRKRRIKYLN